MSEVLCREDVRDDALFGGDGLPLDRGVIVGSATCGAQPVHGGFDVVVAKLAYLARELARETRESFTEFRHKGVLGSRMDRAGNSCPRGRTPRRRAGSTPPRHRRRTGPVAVGTWCCVVVESAWSKPKGGAGCDDTWGEMGTRWHPQGVRKETAEAQINAGRRVAVAVRGIHGRVMGVKRLHLRDGTPVPPDATYIILHVAG